MILTTTHDFLLKFEIDNVRSLQGMGYTVHYAANLNEPCYLSDERIFERIGVYAHHIEIARSPFLWKDNRKALRQVLWLIEKYRICFLHCHTPVGGLLGRLAGKYSRSELFVVYTAHGFHFYRGAPFLNQTVYYQVEKQMARLTDVLITVNAEDYSRALRFRLKKDGCVYWIPGVGFDPQKFRPLSPEEKARRRKQLEIGKQVFFLVSVGELNKNKNQRVVLEALSRMKQRNGGRLSVLYGICGDGYYRERVEKWIQELCLTDEVCLFGYCRNVPEILGCADAAVFPSKREGLGMAGIEALAMGIPVIASDNRGTREYMQQGENGFVFQSGNIEELMRSIIAVREQSVSERAAMSARCIRSAEPFKKEKANVKMQQIYEYADQIINTQREEKPYDNKRRYGCL